MSPGLFAAAIVSVVFQAIIAFGMLALVYVTPFGLRHLAENGADLLSRVDSLQSSLRQCSTDFSGTTQIIRSTLVGSNRAFDELANFLGTAAIVLLVCLVVQTAVLFVSQRKAGSNKEVREA